MEVETVHGNRSGLAAVSKQWQQAEMAAESTSDLVAAFGQCYDYETAVVSKSEAVAVSEQY